ncbi:MAG: hypothetical protein BJ554DRAFT_5213 [Olpidium bornovanus]|uniref:Uncharacterized protein n=1 Tax=Olpidium bornovanus TaxID=278681 RepID=A0A8H8DL76_9FUNG|nr:MAG: hypothetical protein BJ554DRAFT_5213 [Olpidium bornovanus]
MASAASAPSDLPPDPGPPCCFPSSSKPKISTTSFGGDRQSPVPRPTPSSVPVCVTAHPQVHSPPGILAPRAPAPGPTPSQAFDDSSSAERRIPPGVDLRTLVTASRAARESRQPDGPHEPPQEQATQRPTSSSSHWSAPQTAPAAGAPGIGAASLLRHAAAASQSDADGLPQTPASCSSRGLSFKGAAARQREKSRMIIRQ